MSRSIACLFLCLLGAPPLVAATSTSASETDAPPRTEPYVLPRTDLPIEIDGRLDDPAWDDALDFELTFETRPGENVAPPQRTACKMVRTHSHLYYGCHAFDDDPSSIRARYTDRDQSAPSDDTIGIAIDPFNAHDRAYIFDLNPLGVQNDRVFSEISQSQDASWDAIWNAAGQIVDDGYVVEAAIPFASLVIPRGATDTQTWGFNFRRYRPREVYRRIAITPYDRANPCRICQSAELVGFEGVDPGRSLEVTPTLVGTQRSTRDSFPSGGLESDDPDFDPGLTVRWGVTSNLTLGATINPDFSQVEADVAQLDINEQFALFFPEQRPFFLEGADIFRTPVQAVYTRTLADPAWGLKLTGKEGQNGVGGFVLRDEVTNLLFPGAEGSSIDRIEEETSAAVLRYRRDLGRGSTLGVLYTDRRGGDYANQVAGIDGLLRLSTKDTLDFQVLSSRTRYPDAIVAEHDQPGGSFDDHAYFVRYRHSPRGWNVRMSYRDVGEDFRADLGFVPRVDYRQAIAGGGKTWFGDADHWYTSLEVGGDWDRTETQDGDLLEEEWEAFAGFEGSLQSWFFFGGGFRDRTFEGILFEQDFGWLSTGFRPSAVLALEYEYSFGDAIDFAQTRPGEQRVHGLAARLDLGRHVQSRVSHLRRNFDVDAGRLFTADLTELRVVYQINARAFVRTILQRTAIERDPSLTTATVDAEASDIFGQLLFSYKLDARTALYLGYTGAHQEIDDSGLIEVGNTLFFKLSYAWQPG